MEGITIIETLQVPILGTSTLIFGIVVMGGFCLLEILFCMKLYKSVIKRSSKIALLLVSLAAGGLFIWTTYHMVIDNNTYKEEYIVSIDDSVSFNEFVDNYEILHTYADSKYRVCKKEVK